jgi:Mn-dependent DtxR family transcriptional regulator
VSADLTGDEIDALEHIRRGAKSLKVNACIGRNAKKLAGLKLIKIGRNDAVALTEQGAEVLFLRRCIAQMHAVASEPTHAVDADVAGFLLRKSHIVPLEQGGYALTEKGREALADITRK